MGVAVLPNAIIPKIQAAENAGVMRVEEGRKQIEPPSRRAHTKRKKKSQAPSSNDQRQINQTRSNVSFCGTTEWQYSEDLKITDIQDLLMLDEFISQKVRGFLFFLKIFQWHYLIFFVFKEQIVLDFYLIFVSLLIILVYFL